MNVNSVQANQNINFGAKVFAFPGSGNKTNKLIASATRRLKKVGGPQVTHVVGIIPNTRGTNLRVITNHGNVRIGDTYVNVRPRRGVVAELLKTVQNSLPIRK